MDLAGLTNAELARRIECDPNTVSAWRTGGREPNGAALAYLSLLAEVRRLAT